MHTHTNTILCVCARSPTHIHLVKTTKYLKKKTWCTYWIFSAVLFRWFCVWSAHIEEIWKETNFERRRKIKRLAKITKTIGLNETTVDWMGVRWRRGEKCWYFFFHVIHAGCSMYACITAFSMLRMCWVFFSFALRYHN